MNLLMGESTICNLQPSLIRNQFSKNLMKVINVVYVMRILIIFNQKNSASFVATFVMISILNAKEKILMMEFFTVLFLILNFICF